MIRLTVIIPTYKDWERLQTCLTAIQRQSYAISKFEIIVVNNYTDEAPFNFHMPSNCRIIQESKPGSYAARNTGLKFAKGEIIGFTDSDCIPDQYWIENAVKFFEENSECSQIAGRIELFYKSEFLNQAELYESVYAFRQDFAASAGVSVTGNMFTYKKLFDDVGQFNETLMSGGDSEWSLRARAKGYKIMYGKEVMVKHPARDDIKELIKKSKRIGNFYGRSKGKAIFRTIKYSLPPLRSFSHTNHLAVPQRFTIFKLRYFLNLVRSLEEIKISFGKTPNRS